MTVVEDHLLFAETLQLALIMEGHDVRRVWPDDRWVRASRLCRAIMSTRPGVVLLDLDLGPWSNGMSLLDPLRRESIVVVVVTASTDEARWGECLWRGARTVLSKSAPLSTILATIRRVADDQPVITAEESDRLLSCYRREMQAVQRSRARLDRLTPREQEVLVGLMHGRHVREMAREAHVSEATVRTQVKSILAKLGVSSQLAAVGVALQARWRVDPAPTGPIPVPSDSQEGRGAGSDHTAGPSS